MVEFALRSASGLELDSEDRSSSDSGVTGERDRDPYLAGRSSCIIYSGALCIQNHRSGPSTASWWGPGSAGRDPTGASMMPRLPSSWNIGAAVRVPGLITIRKSKASGLVSIERDVGPNTLTPSRRAPQCSARPGVSHFSNLGQINVMPAARSPSSGSAPSCPVRASTHAARSWPRLVVGGGIRFAYVRRRSQNRMSTLPEIQASSETWRFPNHALSFGNGGS